MLSMFLRIYVSNDHDGQTSVGYRWPVGTVRLMTASTFPLENTVSQLIEFLYMGNKPVLKPAEEFSLVMEQFLC